MTDNEPLRHENPNPSPHTGGTGDTIPEKTTIQYAQPPEQNQQYLPYDVQKPRKKLWLWFLLALAGICLPILGGVGTWLILSMQKPSATIATAEAPKVEPVRNLFWQQAQSIGAQTCTQTFSELGSKLALGASYSVQSSVKKDAAEKHALQAIAGLAYDSPNTKLQAAGVVFAAPVNGHCEGNAVRVMPVAQSCAQVFQSRLIQNSTGKPQDLSGIAVYEYSASGDRVALVPAPGNTCVIVSVLRGDD